MAEKVTQKKLDELDVLKVYFLASFSTLLHPSKYFKANNFQVKVIMLKPCYCSN